MYHSPLNGSQLQRNLNSHDPLSFIPTNMGFAILKNHSVAVYTFLSMVFILVESINIYGLTDILSGSSDDMARYIPMIAMMQPGCISLILIRTYVHFCVNYQDKIFEEFCSLNNTDTHFQKKLSRDRKAAMYISIIYFLFVQVVFIAFMVPAVGDEYDCIYVFKMIQDAGQYYGIILMILLAVCVIVISVATAYPPVVALYFVLHLKFQTDLLNHYLEKNIKNLTSARVNPMHDIKFQKIIYHRLTVCAEYHAKMRKYQQNLSSPSHSTALLLYLSTCLMLTGGLFFIIAEISASSNFRIYLSFVSGAAEALLFTCSGQILVDVSNRYYEILCECPWYNWNIRNRKALMMMLAGAAQPFKITFFGIAELDFGFILKLSKTTYSLLAVARNMK
ncbi:unnamed protein product [Phaedon cochleariae]|uniref:Odorant receptor n=1 Tax=Phaedon cochleariae TaxID=80249 RepID=A0A9P0GND7_PHACE|nr:unnamed protein product [Phaedon cochleariae]